ncbi:MAG: glutathione S-transferase family protein, partial [Prochloraceae cyanobacterium]|nr:glutathione S-transferase family protein [Prochloraceae cyanobacterium]
MPFTRAMRPRWLLEEMDISYELIKVSVEDSEKPDYKEIHPLGKIPVLIDKEVKIYESAAICTYLGDKYIEKGFAPANDSPARASYYQWLFYASTTLDAPVEQYMFLTLPNLPEKLLPFAKKVQVSKKEIIHWFERVCQPIAEALENKKYLVDERFSVADLIVSDILLWALKMEILQSSVLIDYVQKTTSRPARNRAR